MLLTAEKRGLTVAAAREVAVTERPQPGQGFRPCLRALAWAESFGTARLVAACRRAPGKSP